MTATVTARGPLKVVAILNAAELLDIAVPDGQPRFVLTIRMPQGRGHCRPRRQVGAAGDRHGASRGPRRWPPSSRGGCPATRSLGRPVGAAEVVKPAEKKAA